MNTEQLRGVKENMSARASAEDTRSVEGLHGQAQKGKGKINSAVGLKPGILAKPRILIVNDSDTISGNMETILLRAGFAFERVRSMRAGCDSARSGEFQVVITVPNLSDGSWKRLAYVDRHHRPGFVIILVATDSNPAEMGQALEDGAFDVIDAQHALQDVAESARRALWAAYLKGAGSPVGALSLPGVS